METILIVGINGSIGKAVATFFTEKGILCLGTSSRKDLLKNKIKGMFFLDLTDHESIDALNNKLPMLDAIIFCSGLEPSCSLNDTNIKHHQNMMNIHVSGPLFVVQSLNDKIKKGGSIIFISSIAAKKGSYDPSYAIAKSAVEGMTRTLANELGTRLIRVNAIAPGLVKNTPVHKRMTQDFRENHLKKTLLKKLTTSIDCAQAIYFLHTQKQMTGQLVHINGGQYFGN